MTINRPFRFVLYRLHLSTHPNLSRSLKHCTVTLFSVHNQRQQWAITSICNSENMASYFTPLFLAAFPHVSHRWTTGKVSMRWFSVCGSGNSAETHSLFPLSEFHINKQHSVSNEAELSDLAKRKLRWANGLWNQDNLFI